MASTTSGSSGFSASSSASSQSSDGGTLCPVCSRIGFERYLRRKLDRAIRIGSWKDVLRRRRCPFCRLIVHTLRTNRQVTPYYPATTVWLDNRLSWELGIELLPYERNVTESYSNKYDLRSIARRLKSKGVEEVYRFVLSTDESAGSIVGCIQSLIRRDAREEERQFLGRQINGKGVSISLIKSWLDRCYKYHQGNCEDFGRSSDTHGPQLPRTLRLIDVVDRKIVLAAQVGYPEYVCLSYVWGTEAMRLETGAQPAILTTSHIESDSRRKSIPLPVDIPSTIWDAIEVTKALGFRYLWNDALCIVQDDPEDLKALHLSQMHVIYDHAKLVIAAASAIHADCGIPRWSVPRECPQYTENVGDLRLAAMSPSYAELEKSSLLPWNSRGWTLQEKLMSKRILLFTKWQAYFKFSEAIWTEEIHMETAELSKSHEARACKYRWGPLRPQHYGRGPFMALWNPRINADDGFENATGFLDYASMAHEHTLRTLSVPSDAMFSIGGLLEGMEESMGSFIFALPETYMLDALLWHPSDHSLSGSGAIKGLPSWTWVAHPLLEGHVNYDTFDDSAFRYLVAFFSRKRFSTSSHQFEFSGRWTPTDLAVWQNLLHVLEAPVSFIKNAITGINLRRNGNTSQLKYETSMDFFADGALPHMVRFSAVDKGFSAYSIGMGSILDKAKDFLGSSTLLTPQKKSVKTSPSAEAIEGFRPALIFNTIIVKIQIGKPLLGQRSHEPQRTTLFELLDPENRCIGEVWTTHAAVASLASRRARFLTLSSSFQLAYANVHPTYVPKWSANTAGFKDYWDEREKRVVEETDDDVADIMEHGLVGYAEKLLSKWNIPRPEGWMAGARATTGKSSFGQLYKMLATTKQGEPHPRSLWSVVNLILVDWDGHRAKRLGVGKVIMNAWKTLKTDPQEVVFV